MIPYIFPKHVCSHGYLWDVCTYIGIPMRSVYNCIPMICVHPCLPTIMYEPIDTYEKCIPMRSVYLWEVYTYEMCVPI